VVVVGAGGAGLRATLGMAEQGLKTACITKVFPTRSHTVAAQGGIAASLGNMTPEETGSGTCTTPSRARTGSATSTPSNTCAAKRRRRSIELEHYGVPFSRTEEGKIYQRPFGGHMQNYGEGPPVQRTCAAADRTGHAILHTLYGSRCAQREFFIEYFALDLIMVDDGAAAAASSPGTSTTARSTASAPRWWCWRPAATAAPISRHLGPHLHRRRRRHDRCAPACRCRTWSSCSSTRPASTARAV
jgi:succinate dehydrogenase/fumarate reductase flavoprotein subunit